MKECNFCGYKNNDDDIICADCGHYIDTGDAVPEEKNNKKRNAIIIAAVVIILAVAVGVAVFAAASSKNTEDETTLQDASTSSAITTDAPTEAATDEASTESTTASSSTTAYSVVNTTVDIGEIQKYEDFIKEYNNSSDEEDEELTPEEIEQIKKERIYIQAMLDEITDQRDMLTAIDPVKNSDKIAELNQDIGKLQMMLDFYDAILEQL